MKKKIVSLMLVSAMAVSMVACGSSGSSGSTGTSGDSASGSTESAAAGSDENTLTVWCWDPAFNIFAMNEAAKVYQKDHPDVTVNVVETPWEDVQTKLTTAATSGDLSTLPDILLMQDNAFQKNVISYPDAFTDLTDSGIDFSQFAEGKTAYSVVDGKNYGVPFDNGAVIECLRTDMLEQAGYTVDDFTDITWSDFMEKAKVVKEKTGQPILTSQAGSPDLVMEMLQSCGQSLFNEDGSVNIKDNKALKPILEIYQQMVADGTIVEVTDWDQYIASINNGTVAGVINGCWIMASIVANDEQSGQWAITNMPKLDGVDGATNYSNNGGSSWVISSNCQKQDLAIDFMKSTFAGSTDLYDDIISKGALATWAPAGDTDVYAQPVEFFSNEAVYAKIVDFATKTPSNITGPFYYDARDAVGVALSNIIQSGADMDDEIATAQDTVEFNMGG